MKNILYGLLSSVLFFIFTWFILAPISSSIFGDSVQISFHLFTYMGLILLFGLIVTCTLFIIQKFNEVIAHIKQVEKNFLYKFKDKFKSPFILPLNFLFSFLYKHNASFSFIGYSTDILIRQEEIL